MRSRERECMPENYEVFEMRAESMSEYVYKNHQNPQSNWWGMYSYDDASAGIGGGVGMIEWFPTRADLLAYIADVFPYWPGGPYDTGVVASVTTAITANMQLGNLSDDEAIIRLNHILRRYSQIEWIGTFEQLCSSDNDYCQYVRKWYREHNPDFDEEDGNDPSAPISHDEISDFCKSISEYGL